MKTLPFLAVGKKVAQKLIYYALYFIAVVKTLICSESTTTRNVMESSLEVLITCIFFANEMILRRDDKLLSVAVQLLPGSFSVCGLYVYRTRFPNKKTN